MPAWAWVSWKLRRVIWFHSPHENSKIPWSTAGRKDECHAVHGHRKHRDGGLESSPHHQRRHHVFLERFLLQLNDSFEKNGAFPVRAFPVTAVSVNNGVSRLRSPAFLDALSLSEAARPRSHRTPCFSSGTRGTLPSSPGNPVSPSPPSGDIR